MSGVLADGTMKRGATWRALHQAPAARPKPRGTRTSWWTDAPRHGFTHEAHVRAVQRVPGDPAATQGKDKADG